MPHPLIAALVLVTAMLVGTVLGMFAPGLGVAFGGAVDPLVFSLVVLVFVSLRWDGARVLRRAPLTVAVALALNFLCVPLFAVALTSVLPPSPLVIGILLYLLAPCTDWFLGFTKLAAGDTATASALLPVQFVLQLLLYPIWLSLIAPEATPPASGGIGQLMFTWVLLPALIAFVLRVFLRALARSQRAERVLRGADAAIPVVIAALVFVIFTVHAPVILSNLSGFWVVLAVVFAFFAVMFAVVEGVSRLLRLPHPQHALLSITTSARNAPLMLALTTAAMPDQPVVAAAIVLGMLVEFPHLTVLSGLLARRARTTRVQTPAAVRG